MAATRWAGFICKLKAQIGAQSTYALGDQIIYSFGNMVVAATLSRHCAQREFGTYILTQRSLDVLIQLSNVFLWAPFTFNFPGTPEARKANYQGSMLALQVLLCLVFTLMLWFASRWAASLLRGVYFEAFTPLIATSGGILFREFTRRMYFAHLRLREAFWTDVVTVLLQIAGVEWLYVTGRLDITHTLAVLCFGAVTVSLWWFIRDWRSFTLSLRCTREDLRLNLRLGRWFLGSNMVFLASSQCNPWVLSALLGGASVGAYSVCESIVNIPRVALTSMQNILGPVTARAHREGGRRSLGRAVEHLDRRLLIVSTSFAVLILVTGPWLAHVIFRTVLSNGRTILLILSLNLVAYAATLAQAYGLTALGRANVTLYANALGLLVQAAVCAMLVRRYQIPGAAMAMLLGSVVVFVVRGWVFRREMAENTDLAMATA